MLKSKTIAPLAAAPNRQIAPHVNRALIAAASLQQSQCRHNGLIMDAIERFDVLYAELIDLPLRRKDG